MKNKSRRSQSIQVFVDKIPQSCQEWTSQQILYNAQKVQKTPRATALILQVSASMLTVKIHDSFNKYGLFEGIAGKKPLLLQKNMTVWLKFAKLHLKKPQEVFGQTRLKRRCLAILLSTMFGKNKYLMSSMLVLDGWWFGFVLQLGNWAPCIHWVDHEICHIWGHLSKS